MDFIGNDQKNSWGSLSYAEKNRALYLKQKQTLDLFLERARQEPSRSDRENAGSSFVKNQEVQNGRLLRLWRIV